MDLPISISLAVVADIKTLFKSFSLLLIAAHYFCIFDGIKSHLIQLTKIRHIILTEVARLKCLNGNCNPKQNVVPMILLIVMLKNINTY